MSEETKISKADGPFINAMCRDINRLNKNWWIDIHTGQKKDRNIGELLCLVHSEISEAM